jgi:hypothetical protein
MALLSEIMVWKRIDETSAVRYCCLNDILSNKYAVQSTDFFRLPLEEKQFRDFDKQFVELFIEVSVFERCDWFDSILEAISAHDQGFFNLEQDASDLYRQAGKDIPNWLK